MSIKEVLADDLKAKIGPARLKKMSPYLRNVVFGGHATLAVDGLTYRATSAGDLALASKSAPERMAALMAPEPTGTLLDRLRADVLAEQAAARMLEPHDELPSPAVRAMLAADRDAKAKATVTRIVQETTQEIRVRIQREADARRAARDGKRPAADSKLARMFDGGKPPKGAA